MSRVLYSEVRCLFCRLVSVSLKWKNVRVTQKASVQRPFLPPVPDASCPVSSDVAGPGGMWRAEQTWSSPQKLSLAWESDRNQMLTR